ncbi:MAG: type I DNA topoisomerase [Armatimonadetes bacterium]|nr:type I DNA topoisomerase [Armatimonadota bacterium]MDW8121797.1 type I DNA topoisomerase [Armatimonadota bacterium]
MTKRKDKKTRKGSQGESVRTQTIKPEGQKEDGQVLLIVESPAKARTIQSLLGRFALVESTMGHLMDLPEKRFGVDIEKGFEPEYVLRPKREAIVEKLRQVAQRAREIYLASDPDREGEAIAWHIQKIIERDDAKRIELHEITKPALQKALETPRAIDEKLVQAQQARRVLDRIFGYSLSPLLWKKIRSKLSAGRVQSVALRLLVEREREIQSFVPQEYWTLTAIVTPEDQESPFSARLIKVGELKVVTPEKDEAKKGNGEGNGTDSRPKEPDNRQKEVVIRSESEVQALITHLKDARYWVAKVERGERKRTPPPPFITSTLQQEASRKLGFSPSRTMRLAQELYEGIDLGPDGRVGLITYMRTDSPRVSQLAQQEARDFIKNQFGPSFLPPSPRHYRAKKTAQEAHEAIRPTSVHRTPEQVAPFLQRDQLLLYRLIWQRFLASQMSDALYDTLLVDVAARAVAPAGEGPHWLIGVTDYCFRATGRSLRFPGWLRVYSQTPDDKPDDKSEEEDDFSIPDLTVGDPLRLVELKPQQSFTKPPARYTQASLIKAMEELGIGRPSTYAPTVDTILQRGYAVTEGQALVPTPLGTLVCDRLVAFFPDLINVGFTAKMEDELDEVEEGRKDWREAVAHFYEPFKTALESAQEQMTREKNLVADKTCPLCGASMVLRQSTYGPFLSCSRYPKCKGSLPSDEAETKPCPNCGGLMVKRGNADQRYFRCLRYPECPTLEPADGSRFAVCPECHKGFLLPRSVRRGKRRGRTFYSCSTYPECRFATWNQPVADPCPQCGSLLVQKKTRKGEVRLFCTNRQCSYTAPIPVATATISSSATDRDEDEV